MVQALQMPIPGERHEHVRGNEQQRRFRKCGRTHGRLLGGGRRRKQRERRRRRNGPAFYSEIRVFVGKRRSKMKIMIRKMIKSTSGSKSKLVMSRPTARGYVFPMKPQIQG